MKISYFRNHIDTFEQNPQYFVTLTDPDELDEDDLCTLIVSLTQKRSRQLGREEEEAEELLSIGNMNRYFSSHWSTEQILASIELLDLQGLWYTKWRAGRGRRGRPLCRGWTPTSSATRAAAAAAEPSPTRGRWRPGQYSTVQYSTVHAGGGGQVRTRLLS